MSPRSIAALVVAVTLSAVTARGAESLPVVSFHRDVMAVLSKAGCNAGLCHGNLYGKGGFKLSLRGESPDLDYIALTRDQFARRIDPLSPDSSLILIKATAAIPHEGGKRFDPGSPEYEILQRWITAGVPSDVDTAPALKKITVSPVEKVLVDPDRQVQLTVIAEFADGAKLDVTRMAVFDPADQLTDITPAGLVQSKRLGESTVVVRYLNQQRPVRLAFIPNRADFKWEQPPVVNAIDAAVFARLKSLRIGPSDLCTDSVFIRRASLDILGRLPTADEARAFVADTDAGKRAKLIDQLVQRPEFADSWALKWADLLRNEERVLDSKGVAAFYGWIRKAMADATPLDEFARELLTARGSTYSNPPSNYYRALRDPTARSEATAQVFLGTRLQCARCHNHPFERWTMDDYYGFAAMFAKVDYKIIENNKKDKSDKNMFIGEQIVMMNEKNQVMDPRTAQAVAPRLLGGIHPDAEKDLLGSAASWIASADNKLFAQVMANRIWYHLMGRGVVDPIDDFRITNPPSNRPLLDAITAELVRSGFDLRQLVRFIAGSRVYQLASDPTDTNSGDVINFSHAAVRRLSAEQLIDGMSVALAAPATFNGYPEGTRAMQIKGVNAVYRDKEPSPADAFLKRFGKPPRLINCECERSTDTALGQVFELTSGQAINQMITEHRNRIGRMLEAGADPAAVVDDLYWAALSRGPTGDEAAAHSRYLADTKDPRTALEDIAWGLVNAKEFVLRH